MGPSANPNVCPINEKLGRFDDNVGHSNGRYGLRIFHGLVPRKYPCKPITYDHTNATDPYHENPLITSNFNRFVGWKNKRNAAIAEAVADVRFNDFKTADNVLAGIEFSINGYVKENKTQITNALVIGKTANTEDLLDISSPHGVIFPRKEHFLLDGARFFNFDWNQAAAIGTCSHCWHN